MELIRGIPFTIFMSIYEILILMMVTPKKGHKVGIMKVMKINTQISNTIPDYSQENSRLGDSCLKERLFMEKE